MEQTDDLKLSPQVNVYLLTENRLLRDTLARLLKKRSEINVVGVSRSSETVKDEILSSHCDVVLTDCFDNTARSTFLRDVLGQDSGVKLLLFGMNDDPDVFFTRSFWNLRLPPQGRFSRGDRRGGACRCPRRSHLSPEPLHDIDSTSEREETGKIRNIASAERRSEGPHSAATPAPPACG